MARSHLEGTGCRQCTIDSYRKPQEQFIKEVQEKHGNKFDLSKIKYINNYTDVEVICKKHNESFWIDPLILLTSNICCPKCRSEYKTKSLETFIEEARAVHGDKYDYSKVVYKSANEKVEIICPIHGSFYQKPSNHIHGQGCVKCAKKYQPTTEEYKQFLQDHFGDAYDYSKVIYINSSTPVEIVCPEHGSFFRKPCHIREVIRKGGSILCPHCSESEGEHKVFEFLKNKYIEYEKGKRFEKCISISTLPFDFYLPDYNLCIEYQGAQHYSKDAYNRICCGSTKYGGFEGLQQRDQKKRDYCKENKISLLEIKFDIPLPKIGDKLDHLFKKLSNFPSSHIFLSLDEEKIEPY